MVSTTSTAAGTVVDARMSLALWLRTGRAQKGMSLDDVARVTKIQPRILEKLEAGKLDGLPAEVFVRGFVRAFARCIGLDEDEALRRYRDAATGAQVQTGPSATVTPVGPAARALVESMAELAPVTARTAAPAAPVVLVSQAPLAAGSAQDLPRVDEVIAAKDEVVVADVAEANTAAPASSASASASSSKKKARGKKRANKRKNFATGTPSSPMPVVAQSVVDEALGGAPAVAVHAADAAPVETAVEAPAAEVVVEAQAVDVAVDAPAVEPAPVVVASVETPVVEAAAADVVAEPVAPWQPKMPTVVAPTVPWRRPSHAVAPVTIARVVPSLVIDDADPDNAERELEERAAAKEPRAKARSFLPPILLDPDRSARQGGLTLAVIILLIAATLTLSYLMRRPGSSGDGVTQATPAASTDVVA